MEKLLGLFDRIHLLSPELRLAILRFLKVKRYRKKDIILRVGQQADCIYFIHRGLVRSTIPGSKEFTGWIMREGDIFLPVLSFFRRIPSTECIEALEDCEVYCITFSELESLYRDFPEFNLHRAVILENYYCESETRHNMRRLPAFQRYLFLMENEPHLVGRVQDKYLSSYLGMNKSTYSAQRKRYARSKK